MEGPGGAIASLIPKVAQARDALKANVAKMKHHQIDVSEHWSLGSTLDNEWMGVLQRAQTTLFEATAFRIYEKKDIVAKADLSAAFQNVLDQFKSNSIDVEAFMQPKLLEFMRLRISEGRAARPTKGKSGKGSPPAPAPVVAAPAAPKVKARGKGRAKK